MKTVDFAGGHVALYTPMSADGLLDVAALEGLADRVASAGQASLRTRGRRQLDGSRVRHGGKQRCPVAAGRGRSSRTGTTNTRSTIEQTQRAAALGSMGARGGAYYNKPLRQRSSNTSQPSPKPPRFL